MSLEIAPWPKTKWTDR